MINNKININKDEINHELTKDTLIFCIFKSFHFEFRKTLPNLSKVDFNLLFLSNNIRKYTR
jgi:hypothetical protein